MHLEFRLIRHHHTSRFALQYQIGYSGCDWRRVLSTERVQPEKSRLSLETEESAIYITMPDGAEHRFGCGHWKALLVEHFQEEEFSSRKSSAASHFSSHSVCRLTRSD